MLVHSIESLAALDGEGLRYGIFLAGCPLRCIYCHNPDTWTVSGGGEKTAQQLFAKIKRYKTYFKASGGGVTFSGGEPLLQADEILKLSELLKQEDINYCLDTSGCVELTNSVKEAVLNAELVICDLKFYTEADYKKYTGGSLEKVVTFLDFLYKNQKRVWLRTVIVPTVNDSEADIDGYLKIASPYFDCVEKYQLLAFHTMGFFKYEKLGVNNPCKDLPALSTDKLKNLQQYLDKQKENYNVKKA